MAVHREHITVGGRDCPREGILDLDLFSLLTKPLPFDQVTPTGFLLVQKLIVTTFGPSDYALRLFPFVFSLVSLVAFWRLSVRILPAIGALITTLLFATAAPFVVFSGIVKQYSTDVCVAVLMWRLVYELLSRPVTARRPHGPLSMAPVSYGYRNQEFS